MCVCVCMQMRVCKLEHVNVASNRRNEDARKRIL